MTVAEAQWIANLSVVAPDLSPWKIYTLARIYVQTNDADRYGLDALVAFAPWRGQRPGRTLQASVAQWLIRFLVAQVGSGESPTALIERVSRLQTNAAGQDRAESLAQHNDGPWSGLVAMAEFESPGSTTRPKAGRARGGKSGKAG